LPAGREIEKLNKNSTTTPFGLAALRAMTIPFGDGPKEPTPNTRRQSVLNLDYAIGIARIEYWCGVEVFGFALATRSDPSLGPSGRV
jgi:hypothetical protein